MRPPSIGAPRAPKTSLARYVHGYHPVGSGVDHLAKISSSPSAMSNRLTAHTDQASRAEVRRLIPPTVLPWSLAPSLTTPLYSTTGSQTLRQPLRSRAGSDLLRTPSTRSSQNSTSTHLGE